jgi:phage-related tail fiber protein
MADFYTLLTNAGIAYENACKAAGVPIKLTQMSVGDGNGAAYNPAATATALKREVWRGPLNALFQDEQNPSWLLAEVTIPPDVGGWYVREAGLWTDTGILYAIVKYPESFKPVLASSGSGKEFYIRSIFETSNASSVTLLIDDTVVKATRAWVTGFLADELAKLDGKQSVRVATTENIVLSGAQQIDGVAVLSGQRVLVAAQTAAKDNGIYVAANAAWVRAADANTSAKVTPGLSVSVEEGAAFGDSLWQLVTNGPITLGTTALSFEMLAGRTGIQAGTYKSVTVDKYGRATGGSNPETLAGFGIKDTYTKPEIDAIIAQASALPVGSMVAFPVHKIPPGFLEINGGEWPIAQYPDLAAFLGTAFNKGTETAGYFRLPESRGEFLRGWDNGRGVDVGRAIGSYQGDAIRNITGNLGILYRRAESGATSGVFVDSVITPGLPASASSAANLNIEVKFDASDSVPTAAENRPRSLAVMWCIKAWNAPINQGSIDIAALAAQVAVATPINYLEGFVLSNHPTVPASVINVSRGTARASGNPVFMSSTMACFLNASGAWAAGTNGQKLDAGGRTANTWYHVFVIRATVGGAADVLVSLSYSAPKLPTGYELIRRIGSIKTDALNAIIPFQQFDRMFYWKTPIRDVVLTNVTGVALANYAISVPPGAPVVAHVSAFYSGSNGYIYLRNPDFPDLAVGPYTAFTYGFGSVSSNTPLDSSSIPMEVLTNIDAQVGVRTVTGETQTEVVITTYGWQEKF